MFFKRTKDQHFVPQSYLRLFSNDEKNIWVYDKQTNEIKSQKIKNTGFIKNFYSSRINPAPFDDNSPVPDLEGKALLIIQKIESKKEVTSEDLGILLNFIALQFLRTPARRENLDHPFQTFWKELRKRYRAIRFNSTDLRVKYEEIAKSFIVDQAIEGLTPEAFLMSDSEIVFTTEEFVNFIALNGFKLAKSLAEQEWEILFADEGENFLTSDDPFSTFDSKCDVLFPILTKDKIKIIPLSKRMILSITGNGPKIRIKKLLPWAIKVINLGIVDSASRFVFSPTEVLLKKMVSCYPIFKKDPASFIEN